MCTALRDARTVFYCPCLGVRIARTVGSMLPVFCCLYCSGLYCSLASSVSVVRAQPCGSSSRLGTGASQCGLTLGWAAGAIAQRWGTWRPTAPRASGRSRRRGAWCWWLGRCALTPRRRACRRMAASVRGRPVCWLVLGLSAAGCACGGCASSRAGLIRGGRAEIVSLCGYSALNCPCVGIRITRTVRSLHQCSLTLTLAAAVQRCTGL